LLGRTGCRLSKCRLANPFTYLASEAVVGCRGAVGAAVVVVVGCRWRREKSHGASAVIRPPASLDPDLHLLLSGCCAGCPVAGAWSRSNVDVDSLRWHGALPLQDWPARPATTGNPCARASCQPRARPCFSTRFSYPVAMCFPSSASHCPIALTVFPLPLTSQRIFNIVYEVGLLFTSQFCR
jgi:hypothetical protein